MKMAIKALEYVFIYCSVAMFGMLFMFLTMGSFTMRDVFDISNVVTFSAGMTELIIGIMKWALMIED